MIVAAFVVSVVALLGSGVAAFYTRQQAVYSKQAAEAAATQARLDQDRRHEELAAQAAAPRWKVTHHEGDLYALTNVTTRAAHAVEATNPPNSGGDSAWDVVAPGESVTFMYTPSWGTPHSNLTVGWQPDPANPDGRETATLLIPRKPK
jgi:hypothetical protein